MGEGMNTLTGAASERDRSQNFIWGDFCTDKEELDARRRFMLDDGYRLCSIPACNCGSWHGGNASRRLSEIRDLLDELEVPTNGLTLLDAIRNALGDKEGKE